MSGKSTKYIKSRSPQGLRLKMDTIDRKDGIIYHYYNIMLVGEYWYAWYKDEGKNDHSE